MTRRLLILVLAAVLAGLGAVLPRAQAAPPAPRESTFQDDSLLVYNTPVGVSQTLDTLHALGVNRVRVSVFWGLVAPSPKSKSRPSFDAADPNAYPAGSWDRYDRIVTYAATKGIAVNFNVTDPAPLWATGSPPRADIEATFEPQPKAFGDFVHAVATRYSGTFMAPKPTFDPQHPGAPAPLPRVDYWAIWNEPNQPGWLTPQLVPGAGRRLIERAPTIYRALVDAAYAALTATGHGSDTILVGETAPKGLNTKGLPPCSAARRASVCTGAIKPLHFIRQLYCLDDSYHPLRGATAAVRGCPVDAAGTARFITDHPGLFMASGWAHHPYELIFAPNRAPADPDFVTIASLGRLTDVLQRILGAYGEDRPGGMPLYLTEFGYQSTPPSPIGVSLSRQAAYLNQSEFIAYTNPHVRTLSQFLLRDDSTRPGATALARAGASFQTGLEFHAGKRKPAYAAYRLPVYLPSATVRRNHRLRVWGFVRLSAYGTTQQVSVELRPSRGRAFRTIATVPSDGQRGYVDARVRIPTSGFLRLSWNRPGTHQIIRSRVVGVRVR
ncbi:MAG: hypothetical protein QOF77_2195 [Solirubrobacteraceae bacterium]|jgi:hypothetical protein|nr:hypothetical protein [Solirubrobacteraceae bacterium]